MVVIGWEGFPQYGARCVAEFVRNCSEKVMVLATRPSVPIRGMDKLAGCPVVWLEKNERRSIVEICGEMPCFMMVPGWASPMFDRLRKDVVASGGVVACASDNNYVWSLKEVLKAVRFRLFLRRKFDYFFVPGKSGRRLLRFYGVPDNCIVEGCYAADGTVFHDGLPLQRREKKIVCVARFIEWKNAKRLMWAFARAVEMLGPEAVKDWALEFYGSGPLKDELENLAAVLNHRLSIHGSHIFIYDFLQPDQLSERYRESRIFCLPSLNEHWGLVVHEGALSGCVLLLSKNVGAAADLLSEDENGYSFDPYDVDDMARTLSKAMTMTDSQLTEAHDQSIALAKNVSLERFASAVKKMVEHAG